VKTSQEVVSVAGTVESGTVEGGPAEVGTVQSGRRHNILNSDGQPHPRQNALTIFTLVIGLVSFVLGMLVRNTHTSAAVVIITTATGLVACLVGLYVQMISATREQRILIVTGIIAGFVGLAIALGHGGFTA
jgi:ammonia channel protein AmtB